MEALIGATYVSNDIETARQLVMRLIGPLLKDAGALGAGTDWKTSIQELAASRQMGTIYYAVEGTGPDHARTFTAVLNIGGKPYGNGSGHSKKEAEQEAAADAWRQLSPTLGASAAEDASPESSRSV
ncbi:ribonuclease 3 [Arthrobacter sp. Hiyo4]|nr:ribonuclease 3 [Arthrobacter sp. Hiyo4]